MATATIVEQHLSPIPIKRLWKAAICDAHNLLPLCLPQVFSSIDILQGDGGIGTIKKFNFTNAVNGIRFVKDRVDILDHENHVFKYSVIGGGLLDVKVKSYMTEVRFNTASEGGCLVNLKIDYEPLESSLLSESDVTNLKNGNLAMAQAIDRYLLSNPDTYAWALK